MNKFDEDILKILNKLLDIDETNLYISPPSKVNLKFKQSISPLDVGDCRTRSLVLTCFF